MFKIFFLFSIICGVLSYINIDPIKRSFFLIFSLLLSIPIISVSIHTWFSYFVCLLFLSGIFVILVYFSSLSKVNLTKRYIPLLCLILSLIFFPILLIKGDFLNLNVFYYSIYWTLFIFILLVLILFINFSSYYLNFSGALRKV